MCKCRQIFINLDNDTLKFKHFLTISSTFNLITIFEQLSHLLGTLKIDVLEQLLERRLGLEQSSRCAGQSHNDDVVGGFSLFFLSGFWDNHKAPKTTTTAATTVKLFHNFSIILWHASFESFNYSMCSITNCILLLLLYLFFCNLFQCTQQIRCWETNLY